ncbi:DUF6600 domain-containing protein [Dyadobacter psychrotolerans]|uniref:BcpO-related WXXGXW repeat protein n=1 Tax=Dyadobacter psychrotolerans TaxID=2541721 RepID=A0A4R5DM80_9BACT|nr:DUF6600 domain-containing protein [Dyadobacter psychrotolerans]TDE13150.1 hypothetical protein E0F88_19005 [Dyadobacter psychrotolerans]
MNTLQRLRIFGLSLLLLTGLSVHEKVTAQPGVSISFQTFYNELSPYGRWINSPQYGSVWTPNVSQGFQPYSTNGYWEVTEYGNTWVSDYDWGWAPFHYGRWSFDDYNGWFWIPGYEWGPAWVNWRSGGDYYGWAPLGPGMNVNISINIPSFWWVFVPQRYIATRNWYSYCAPRNRVTHIYNQTTIINNYYRGNNRVYAYGPRRDEMERVTRRSIPVRQLDNNQRGRVITDRRSNDRYDAPNHNAPVYRNDRRAATIDGRYSNDADRNYDNGRYGQSNGRTGSSNPGYDRPGSDRSGSERSGQYGQGQTEPGRGRTSSPDVYNNRSSEPARQSNNPGAEQRREYGNPSSGSDRGSRSGRSAEMGNSNSGRSGGEAPAVRSAPAERNSAPRNSGRSETRSDNNGGGGRSERSSRSPR